MSLARLVVTAVRMEGRTKAEVTRDYGVSRRWVYERCRRFDVEGEAGLQPRSRRPRASPGRTTEGSSWGPRGARIRHRMELTGRALLDDLGLQTHMAHPPPVAGHEWWWQTASVQVRACHRATLRWKACLGDQIGPPEEGSVP